MAQVVILSQGKTGSSPLAKIFHLCGLPLGDTGVYFHPSFEKPHYEHSVLTRICSRLGSGKQKSDLEGDLEWRRWLIKVDESSDRERMDFLKKILRGYSGQYNDFVIKVTCAPFSNSFPKVHAAFLNEFPNARFFTTLRSPQAHAKSVKRLLSGEQKEWRKKLKKYREFAKIGRIVFLPEDWNVEDMRRHFNWAGVNLCPVVLSVFDEERGEDPFSGFDRSYQSFMEEVRNVQAH